MKLLGFQILPGFVSTKMSGSTRSSWAVPSPKKFVQHALRTVGVASRTTGYYAHALMHAGLATLNYLAGRKSYHQNHGQTEEFPGVPDFESLIFY